MTIELLIARHGNTFHPGEPTRRVGARTDAPLVESEKASAIGRYMKEHQFKPDRVYSSPLKRTYETARIALKVAGYSEIEIETKEIFREIDYGPDENKLEEEVVARVGKDAIQLWNEKAIPPEGWIVDPAKIEEDWRRFSKMVEQHLPSGKVLVVTSNGVARFSTALFGSQSEFQERYQLSSLKIATGALCLFSKSEKDLVWENRFWNLKLQK